MFDNRLDDQTATGQDANSKSLAFPKIAKIQRMGGATASAREPGSLSSSESRFYRPELDGIRFIAFFAVFIFHTIPASTGFYSLHHFPLGSLIAATARAGNFGVDLFFLLSSYLITELLLREKEVFGSIHLRAFYMRRILRIWPVYFLAIGIGVFIAHKDPSQPFGLRYLAGFLLLTGNWVTSFLGFPGTVTTPLWSISVEEQFYLLWPVTVAKVGKSALTAIAAGMIVLSFLARVVLVKSWPLSYSLVSTNTLARLDPFAFGIITAVLTRGKALKIDKFARLAWGSAGIALLVAAGWYYALSPVFLIWAYPLIATGVWMVFRSLLGVGKVPDWLRYLGKISYGLYVFHSLAIYLVQREFGSWSGSVMKYSELWVLSFLLTLGLAIVSYRLLESPFLRLKERFAYVKSRPV